MPQRVRFTHRVLDSGQHAVMSPDLAGFCIVGAPGEDLAAVEQQALEALSLLRSRQGVHQRMTAVEFEAA